MRTLIVVQARTGSTRMPGKVLEPLAGAPLLERMLERVEAVRARYDVGIVVAITVDPSDDPIRALTAELGVRCFSGDRDDLLDRHLQAARQANADVVLKVPSDCPLIDPLCIEQVLELYFANPGAYDYVSNLHPPSYPDGNDVELCTIEALQTAWQEATLPMEREHTTPFIWERPERFRLANVRWPSGLDYSMSHRFTIDYPEDYELIAAVYDALYRPQRPIFGLDEILALLERRHELAEINARWRGVNWYRHHLDELKTVSERDTRRGPPK